MNIVTTGLQEPERLAPSTLEAIRLAYEEAVRMQAQAVFPEHLLLGTIAQGENKAAKILCRCGMDMQTIRVRASEVFGSQYIEASKNDLPLSEESLECIAWAISLTDSHKQYALVLPEPLVLGVLRHPRMQPFLVPFTSSLELLHAFLNREIWTTLIQSERSPYLNNVEAPQNQLATPVSNPAKKCPSCKKDALPGWKHCAYCGALLAPTCPNCGAIQPDIDDARFCFECGSPLKQENDSTPKQVLKEPEAEAKFSISQQVRIIDGPFTEYIGTISAIDMDHNKLTVLISFFGRKTPVTLDFWQVEKI